MKIDYQLFRNATEQRRSQLIDFVQRLVAIPSLSGHEGDVAQVIVAELKRLQFDEVWTDDVGNVYGKICGQGGPTVLLNGHLDIVDPGPPAGWKLPPYSGTVVAGELWGRGSVDMKGPVAAMIYAAAQFKQLRLQPSGDIWMSVAVMEEIGGLGTHFMTQTFQRSGQHIDVAIVGEPSQNQLRLGHRGRLELQVTFCGRSAHASAPELAINPHFAAAEFLQRLGELTLACDPVLGPATIAPTLYVTDQQSANVIPSEVTVFLDWRNVPSESPAAAVTAIQALAQQCTQLSSEQIHVSITNKAWRTYTQTDQNFAAIFPPFATPANGPLAQAAQKIIADSLGRDASPGVWKFATDGGHLAAAGIPVIGFGPGDDRLAHTNQERLSITELIQATSTYGPLVIGLANQILSPTG